MPAFKQLSRSVKGLTAVVTGGASGMGRATARVFADEGAHVAVADVNGDGEGCCRRNYRCRWQREGMAARRGQCEGD